MNQILITNNLKEPIKKHFSRYIFLKIQLTISILIAILILAMIFFYFFDILASEKKSSFFMQNYELINLYSHPEVYNNQDSPNSNLFGIIEIPKLNIKYPIFSNLSNENLKTSPCKFWGDSPNIVGNLCIAGHNYDNGKFFSNLHLLSKNDKIYIYDQFGKLYIYSIFSKYEVFTTDTSIFKNSFTNTKELTLLTCNNRNKKRLIIKCIQK